MQTMQSCLFAGGKVLGPRQDSFRGGVEVLVEDRLIKEVRDRPIPARSATCIDLRGRTLMPGLSDAHVDLVPTAVNRHVLADTPLMLLAAKWCSIAKWAIMLRGRIVKHAL